VTSKQAAPELSYLEHKWRCIARKWRFVDFEQRAYDLFLENYVERDESPLDWPRGDRCGRAAAMRPTDWTFATYRGHAHTLARGVPMTRCSPS